MRAYDKPNAEGPHSAAFRLWTMAGSMLIDGLFHLHTADSRQRVAGK
jgi:hypothetical protein